MELVVSQDSAYRIGEVYLQNVQMPLEKKLEILTDSAKYDVSCSSSGVDRRGNGRDMG